MVRIIIKILGYTLSRHPVTEYPGSCSLLRDTCLVYWEEGLGCALIKSTLGPGNPRGFRIWGGGKVQGSNGGQRG
jgi:hypothetical protein